MLAPQALAQDCVRTVRSISDFSIQGDAWMWWARSAGRYERDNRPSLGSVLVFKRVSHMRRGHVSLVSAVIDRRTIEVDHSWIDGHGLRRGMRVVDVSPRNDWSEVRVWHEPTRQLGQSLYPTYGFILPAGEEPRGRVIEVAASDLAEEAAPERRSFSVAPTGRAARREAARQELVQASTRAGWVKPGKPAPAKKPAIVNASLPADKAAAARAAAKDKAKAVSVAPRRKPAEGAAKTPAPKRDRVAEAPARKPGARDLAQVAARD
ncbi:CHAP domain-containing protein [Azospirillum sp. SYSU D00513]|uniref:CHAP domain-containing protein n=1 Tax=Azospirillum sp. SYSU D00513 TaxID=2812561 RepID=UPI0032B6172E